MVFYLLPLKDRKEVAKETMAFWFDTSETDFSFKPGQYANFALPKDSSSGEDSHVFSIASSPHHKDHLMIATRMRESPFKNALKNIPLGTKVKVNRPAGRFLLHEEISKPAVFLAGGIGITPMMSMIEWATEKKSPQKIHLFYSNRSPSTTAFLKELQSWEKQNPNFKLIATVTDPEGFPWKHEQGRVDEAMIRKHVPDLDRPIFYVVGPPGMVEAMDQLLQRMGIPTDRIRTEKFDGY